MRITHGKMVYILAENNGPLVFDWADVPTHIWSILYSLHSAENRLRSPSEVFQSSTHLSAVSSPSLKLKNSEKQACVDLGVAILKGVALLEAGKVENARVSTGRSFSRFKDLSKHMRVLETPLKNAYRAWVKEDNKDLKICLEVFVVLSTTFLEELVPEESAVEAVLKQSSKLVRQEPNHISMPHY